MNFKKDLIWKYVHILSSRDGDGVFMQKLKWEDTFRVVAVMIYWNYVSHTAEQNSQT